MQFGMWLEALRQTSRALATEPSCFVREFPAAADSKGRLLGLLGEIVQARNKCIHPNGTHAISVGQCGDVNADLRPKLDECLRLVRFITHYPLGFAQAGLGQPVLEERRYYFHSCMGARVA